MYAVFPEKKIQWFLNMSYVSLWVFSSPFLMYVDSFIQLSYHFASDLVLEAKNTGMEKTLCPHGFTKLTVLRQFSALEGLCPRVHGVLGPLRGQHSRWKGLQVYRAP